MKQRCFYFDGTLIYQNYKENERARMIIFNKEDKDETIHKKTNNDDSKKIHENKTSTTEKDDILTVTRRNEKSNTGGILHTKSIDFILEHGSSIDVGRKGYKCGHQGYSYENNPSTPNNNNSNLDGGAESIGGLLTWCWWWIWYFRIRWI